MCVELMCVEIVMRVESVMCVEIKTTTLYDKTHALRHVICAPYTCFESCRYI